MTTTISDFRVVVQDDPDKPISFNVFTSREEAEKWITSRSADLKLAIEDGWLTGYMIQETKIPAKFLIGKPSMSLDYLNFGARILRDIRGYKVIGVPNNHARYLAMRLISGLVLASRDHEGYSTLEEATEDAVRLASGETLYPYQQG